MTEPRPPTEDCLTADEAEAVLRGELEASRRAAHEAHLQHCPRCQAELVRWREENALLADLRRAHESSTAEQRDAQKTGLMDSGAAVVAIEGFEILEELHRGGQGLVYKARQKTPNRLVALKVLREDTQGKVRERVRFEREIELAASLHHPNIVTVYETGVASGRRYLVMEYVDGRRLDEYLAQKAVSVREKVRLLLKIGRAVQAAHQRGVIHRDLKPGNVLVDREGEPRVLDFGIARAADNLPSSEGDLTFVGEFLGTLAYSSPEQVGGDGRHVDVRSDVYSLGVVSYEVLTGRLPYALPEDLEGAVRCIRETSPAPVSGAGEDVDGELETVLFTALAKDVERRYSSAEAFCEDLQRYLDGAPLAARRDSRWYVLRKNLRRHRVAVGLAVAAFVLITGFAVTMAVLYQRAERAAQRAIRTQRFLLDTIASVNAWSLGPDATLFDVLALAERGIETELANQPDVEADLRYTLGLTYASVRHDAAAREHLQAAYDFYVRHGGKYAERVAMCLANLGRIEGDVQRLREAVGLWRDLHGEGAPQTLLCQLDLAGALAEGNAASRVEAEGTVVVVEERLRDRYGALHRYVARAQHVRGWLLARGGQADAAVALYQRALDTYLEQGIPDPYACEMFERYAELLISLGRYADADRVLAQAEAHLPSVFGRAWLPELQWRRGRLHVAMGETVPAEAFYRQALGAHCLHVAADRPGLASSFQQWAGELYGWADAGGLPPYRQVLESLRRERGVDATWLAHAACDLAELYVSRGVTAAALELLRDAGRGARENPLVEPDAMARVRRLLGEVGPDGDRP